MLQEETCPLGTIDVSGNELGEDHVLSMVDAARNNSTLESIDVRLNQVKVDADAVQQLYSLARANELRHRGRRRPQGK